MANPTGATTERDRWLRHLRWFVVPASVGLFVLVGLAISTDDRRTFAGEKAAEADLNSNGDPANPSGDEQQTSGVASAEIDADGNPAESNPAESNPAEGNTGQGGGAEDNRGDGSEDGSDNGSTVEIASRSGQVAVEVGNGSNPIARPSANGGESTGPVELDDGTEQRSGGLRLSSDGRLEPVDGNQIAPGDLVIEQAEDGVDLVGAGGARVEIRPAADGERGFDIAELSADGQRRKLSPDEAGALDLGDGLSLRVPIEGTLDQSAEGGTNGTAGDDGEQLSWWEQLTETSWRWLILAFLALAALAAIIAGYLSSEDETEAPFGPDFVGPDGIPIERFDEFLAMLRNDTDPARALRLAFHAAERGMGDLPPRHSTETPFEWCDRVLVGRPQLSRPLRSLCDRFAATRFAAERPSNLDRDSGLAELLDLQRIANGHEPIHDPVVAK